ncbi:MAG TPA: hypothetical protein VFU31_09250 [Candidatus Binatia bacterium]|nr:hypothetical protein [Candidatus Binatia bacterium]
MIQTRVDSEVARYYLANYLAGKRGDALLDERIDRLYQNSRDGLPNRDDLKKLSDEFSVDFAALYFADQIARVPVNRRFRRAFDQADDYVRKAFLEDRVKLPVAATEYEVMAVPSYLYKRVLVTGADLAAPRAALQRVGLPCHFVETSDDGTIEANADLVVAAIRERAQSGRRLIIISASKSGPEVALALTRLGPAKTRHVAAWINTVGALQGTPLIDDGLLPEVEFFVGKIDVDGVESLTTTRSRQRFESFRVPEHVFVINFFGIPLTGSVSFRGRRGFFPLQKWGPNDGLVLLADLIFPGGVTLVELGSDHFLIDRHLDITAVALAITVIQWLESPGGKKAKCIGAQRPHLNSEALSLSMASFSPSAVQRFKLRLMPSLPRRSQAPSARDRRSP